MPRPAVNPNTTRARVMLEIASELVGSPAQGFAQADITLLPQGKGPAARFVSRSSIASIAAVVDRKIDLAIINPVTPLTLAYRGTGAYRTPQPVRTIGVVPSEDQLVFAVRRETGLRSIEDIAARRFPLRVSLRGQPDHALHPMLDDVLAAAGFSLDDVKSWGGEVKREGALPFPDGPKFKALLAGEIDAIFDEASDVWAGEALDAGLDFLFLSEPTVKKLEAIGYRRALISRARFPRLATDVLTIDFSGWPIFVHAEASDQLVTQICAGLDARKARIPSENGGALPVESICRETASTPQDVPLHPAAERFWRARGYLA